MFTSVRFFFSSFSINYLSPGYFAQLRNSWEMELQTGYDIYLKVIRFPIGITAIIGNALLIAALCFNGKRKDAKYTYILGLAVSDCLTGFVLLATVYQRWMTLCFGSKEYLVAEGFLILALGVSSSHVLVMAMDKFLAIVFPLRYQKYETFHFKFRMVAAVWCMSLVLTVTMIVAKGISSETCRPGPLAIYYPLGAMSLCYLFTIVIVIAIYVKILQIRRQHLRSIRCQIWVTNQETNPTPQSSHGVVLVIAVLIIFIAAWTPYFVASYMNIFIHGSKALGYALIILSDIGLVNSCLNVFLYMTLSKTMRKFMQRLFVQR